MTGRRDARGARAVVAACALAALLGSALSACGHDGPTLKEGTMVTVPADVIHGDAHEIRVPDGVVSLSVDEHLSADDVGAFRNGAHLAGGDRFVGVHETETPGLPGVSGNLQKVLTGGTGASVTGQPGATVSLLAGGHEYRLPAPGSGQSVALAVPDSGDLTIQVLYDGQAQRLDTTTGKLDAGVAEGLYHLPTGAPEVHSCRDDWQIDDAPMRPRPGCRFGVTRVPYLAQGGWAASVDRPWIVLHLQTAVHSVRLGRGTYRAADKGDESTLKHKAPAWTVADSADGGQRGSILAFHAGLASTPVRLARTLTLTRIHGTGPRTLQRAMVRLLHLPATGS